MMLNKCVICGRPLVKVEFYIGKYPVGPTCAKKRRLTINFKFNQSVAIWNAQTDLFEDIGNDT